MVLTTADAARRLGITPGRVRYYIAEHRLNAYKAGKHASGRDWLIREPDLARFERLVRRPAGRPPKRRKSRRVSVVGQAA